MRVEITAAPRTGQKDRLDGLIAVEPRVAGETVPVAGARPVRSHAANPVRPQRLHPDAAVAADSSGGVQLKPLQVAEAVEQQDR